MSSDVDLFRFVKSAVRRMTQAMVMGISAGTATGASHQSRFESFLVDSDRVGEGSVSSTEMDSDASGEGQRGAVMSSGAEGVTVSAEDSEGEALSQYLDEVTPHLDGLYLAVKRLVYGFRAGMSGVMKVVLICESSRRNNPLLQCVVDEVSFQK